MIVDVVGTPRACAVRMISTENGPNLDPPEELNEIREGCHYGFPYQFSDWPKNPSKHIGPPPAGARRSSCSSSRPASTTGS